jgi:hypothetical protein
MQLQPDLRFKFASLSCAIRRTCTRLKVFGVKGSVRRSEQEALSLQAMCTHVWQAHKTHEPWLKELELDLGPPPNCALHICSNCRGGPTKFRCTFNCQSEARPTAVPP